MVQYDTSLVRGCDSRSSIRGWYLACLRCLASFKFSMVLAGMVSSKICTSPPETITRSGWSDVVERLVGMVASGLLLALWPGRSAYRVSDGLRAGTSTFANVCRTESWRQEDYADKNSLCNL